MNTGEKLRIAWFSILPQAYTVEETLSAYFSKEVLPHLKDKFDITLYHNSFEKYPGYETFHYLKAFQHDKENPYDIFFYQIEDDSKSNFVRSHLGLIPGITYFHHFNFTNYGPEPLLNSPYSEVIRIFNNSSRDWPSRENKYKPRGPGAFREAALSAVSIFSNPHSLNEYNRQVELKLTLKNESAVNSFYLPYPVKFLNKSPKKNNQRFDIAYVGTTRIESRAHKVLSAVSKLNDKSKLNWLVPENESKTAKSLLEEFNIDNYELYTGISTELWTDVIAVSDCSIHTLFSAYGHNEPYLSISMSAGLPCLVTNFASNEYLPDNIVFKIQPGDNEIFQIFEVLNSLINEKIDYNNKLQNEFCLDRYDARQVALELSYIFNNKAQYLKKFKTLWNELSLNAKETLVHESKMFFDKDNPVFEKLLEPEFEELGWKI